MRWIRGALLLLVLAAPTIGRAAEAPAPVSDADRQAVVQVIRDQMDAFRRDDAPAAFAFAAPNIQGMFGNDPARFMAMVREGYPPVYRPRSAEFGPPVTVDGQVVEHVEITGPDGVARTAVYTLEREQDGRWRISGCVLSADTSVGA